MSNDPNMPGGGGPPPSNPLGAPSSDDDERALKKGKGRMMAGMIVAVLAAVAALVLYMSPDQSEAYRKFGKNINGLDQAHFDQFWGCAFPGFDLGRIKNNEDLRAQIQGRASGRPNRYGEHIRDECMPKLQELAPELEALIPPDDMQQPVRGLIGATRTLNSAWSDFVAYLDGLGKDKAYDEGEAGEHIKGIAKAWFDYKVELGEINKGIKEKLGR